MAKPNVLVLTGYGINCDEEIKFAFEEARARAELVHVNDLIDRIRKLSDYQILAFPGGFSYGDDTGAGSALANRIRNHLWDDVRKFVESDKLTIGVCNGFQVMVNLGLLPAIRGQYGTRQVALLHNDSARYTVRWVDLDFGTRSVWTKGIGRMSLPIAHGEGRLYTDITTLGVIKKRGLVAARYVSGEICEAEQLPANPNGSLDDIAALSDESGRVLGMMPHPERAITFTQLPDWTQIREHHKRHESRAPSLEGPGMKIFINGVEYFK